MSYPYARGSNKPATIVITINGLYITYLDSNEILSCQLTAGHYCEINTPFTPLTTLITEVITYYKVMMRKADSFAHCQ